MKMNCRFLLLLLLTLSANLCITAEPVEETQSGTSLGIVGGEDGPTSVFVTRTMPAEKADLAGAGSFGVMDMIRYGGLSGRFCLLAGIVLVLANIIAFKRCRGLRWPMLLMGAAFVVFCVGLSSTLMQGGNFLLFLQGEMASGHPLASGDLSLLVHAMIPFAAGCLVWMICTTLSAVLMMMKFQPVARGEKDTGNLSDTPVHKRLSWIARACSVLLVLFYVALTVFFCLAFSLGIVPDTASNASTEPPVVVRDGAQVTTVYVVSVVDMPVLLSAPLLGAALLLALNAVLALFTRSARWMILTTCLAVVLLALGGYIGADKLITGFNRLASSPQGSVADFFAAMQVPAALFTVTLMGFVANAFFSMVCLTRRVMR